MFQGLHNANSFATPGVGGCDNDAHWPVCKNNNMAKQKKPDAPRVKNYLRKWREFRKMTQEQLAAAVDTDKSVISLLEGEGSNVRGLDAQWAHRLAVPLRTRPGYLLDYDPKDLPTEFIDLWEGIPDDQKPHAKRILETFQKKDD